MTERHRQHPHTVGAGDLPGVFLAQRFLPSQTAMGPLPAWKSVTDKANGVALGKAGQSTRRAPNGGDTEKVHPAKAWASHAGPVRWPGGIPRYRSDAGLFGPRNRVGQRAGPLTNTTSSVTSNEAVASAAASAGVFVGDPFQVTYARIIPPGSGLHFGPWSHNRALPAWANCVSEPENT
jgi:hypothetical protein